MAQDLSGYVEFQTAWTERESEVSGGILVNESESDAFIQTYNLNFERAVLPNLRLLLGGLFRRTDAKLTTTAPLVNQTDSSLSTRRPYAKLFLDSDLFRGQLSYTRIDERQEFDGLALPRNVRETLSSFLGWFPDRAPSAQLRINRTSTHDGGREVLDRVEDRVELISLYDAIRPLSIRYRGSRTEFEDRLNTNEVRTDSHNARIVYADTFWNDRWTLSSDYNGTIRETKTFTGGTGEVSLPLFAFEGLSAIDDTPDNGALAPNAGLIDGGLTASAGINLGLPPPGGNDRARNIGLDFGVETELNTLEVWIDRELPAEISGAFVWDIYTSDDNQQWALQETVAPGDFGGPFLPRFELRFANVTTRYIKVAVDPLAPSTPMASSYPLILVTELQPSLRVPADQVEFRTRRTTHVYNLNSRLRLLDAPFVFYELDGFLTNTDRADATYLVTNGISLSHAFNEVFTVNSRVTFESGRDTVGDRQSWVYSASFGAQPVEKWRNNLVISGRSDDLELTTEDRASVLFNTILELYRGVDLNLGIGQTYRKFDDAPRQDTTLYNAIVRLAPHRTLNINLIHRESTAEDPPGTGLDERVDFVNEASLGYTPVQSLYFFGSYRELRRTGEEDRTVRSYAFNWTPFPHGALRFNINYNESYRSEDGSITSSFVPSVRWSIRRSSFLDIAYQRLRSDLRLGRSATDSLFATLRLAF